MSSRAPSTFTQRCGALGHGSFLTRYREQGGMCEKHLTVRFDALRLYGMDAQRGPIRHETNLLASVRAADRAVQTRHGLR